MDILLLGSGGREHALAWKLAQSPLCTTLWASPGNPGIRDIVEEVNARRDRSAEIGEHGLCFAMDLTDHAAAVDFCKTYRIDLVVVGPEAPLVDGLADALRAAGVAVFGPSRAAAQLEGSKGFTKDLCTRAGIPTADYVRAATAAQAHAALGCFPLPVVIKADGLAAGKGVIIAQTAEEAAAAIDDMFSGAFGGAGAEVVIEEFLEGEEVSLFAITDGTAIMPFGSAQDHKRVGEGDTGPNTGGMGAYSPAPVLTAELEAQAMAEIIAPTVKAMAEAGTPYSGVLFAGLMLTASGPRLIEYNCRFGDPECQVLMLRLESDLAAILAACAQGRLAGAGMPDFSGESAMTVVVAAKGYPAAPASGGRIDCLDAAEAGGAKVFHAGTATAEDGTLVAKGGRVLNVCATGRSLREASDRAYAAIGDIGFADGFSRSDIGWRELARTERPR
jgi:phosphoribosylamine--glycine ligase